MSQRQRMGNQPMIVLSEESQRTSGKDAQNMNITAGKAVAESVRTTLGPKGMDKMLVDSGGSVVVTNDGVTILKEMDIDHPAANMIVEVSETQEEEVGDGTTSAVVVAGELLDQAEGSSIRISTRPRSRRDTVRPPRRPRISSKRRPSRSPRTTATPSSRSPRRR